MPFENQNSRDRNNSLAKEFIDGRQAARSELIESNLALVKYRLKLFLSSHGQYKYLSDDLLSVGYVALTEAVSSLKTNSVADVTLYVSSAVDNAISSAAMEDAVIGPTSRTIHNMNKRGEQIETVRVDDFTSDPPCEPQLDFDLLDALASAENSVTKACETDQERRFVELRREGISDADIGLEIGLSRKTVNRMRHRIEERFNSLCLGA